MGRICKNSARLPRSTGQGQAAVGFGHGRKHHEKAGAPSFALFAKGGIRDRRIEIRGIPPFAKKREGWGTRGSLAGENSRERCHHSIAVLLVCCAALLATACNKSEEAAPSAVYVQAVHPIRGTISEPITADATLAPLAQAAISPKVTAPVKKFFVQRGSRVRAGQLLATLENSDLEAAALDNKGAYTAAQGTFDIATRATVPEDAVKAELDLTQARAGLNLAQSIVDSRSQLFAEGAIPGRDLDTAKAGLVQAKATYEIAKQHLEAVQQFSRKAALESAQGQLTSAQGKYLGAEAQLRYTEIRSPIQGVVTDRPLFAGETAAAGTPVITVMDTSALLAKLHLAQTQAQQLANGASASIVVPGVADPVPAKVSLISPALDPGSTTVEVWLRIENPHGTLKAGTPVHATITGRTASNALLVPAEAVQTAPDGVAKSVMIVGPDGKATKRGVKLGIQTATSVQVLDGLSSADTVITTGAYGLDEGTKVKIGTAPSGEDKS
jgi:HlyD family secretion protein